MRQHLGELSDLPPEQGSPACEISVRLLASPWNSHNRRTARRFGAPSRPLAGAVNSHPELCQILAELLSRILQQPVLAQCDCSVAPRCCFNVGPAKSAKS